MSRVRAIVLGALLAVVSVLGVAPAASADPLATGIEWSWIFGTILPNYGPPAVCATDGGSFAPDQTVQVQVLTGGVWVPKRSYSSATQKYGCISVSPFELVAGPGRYALRAVTQFTSGGPVVTADVSVTLAAASFYVETDTDAFTNTTANKVVTATLGVARGQFVDLQRKDGTRWVHVSRVTAPPVGEGVAVRLPVAARVGQSAYRVVSQPSRWTAVAVSPSFTIHQTDYARYASYIAAARYYMRSYCPKTPISINTPRVSAGPRVGLAVAEWATTTTPGQSYLKTHIELRSGLPAVALRHVALHECGHVVQYRAVVEGRYGVDGNRARQIFGANTIEAEADCMAAIYSKTPWLMAYIRSCSAAQANEGYRIWRAYGLKYQAAVYRW